MADIFRKTLKKRDNEAESGTPAPVVVDGPLNQHKKSMTQHEFGKADAEDPRKKNAAQKARLLEKR